MIWYGKKKWVPASCPQCGQRHVLVDRGPLSIRSLNQVMEGYFVGWNPRLGKSDIGLDTWYGECRRCDMEEQINKSYLSIFKSHVNEDRVIPVVYGRK